MIKLRYCIEITDDPSSYCCFSYIDSEDRLADALFDHMKIEKKAEMEFPCSHDPYKIIVVRIPREQREDFLWAIDMLPSFMDYAGREDYEECCRMFFLYVSQYDLGMGATGETALLQ